MNVLFHLHKYPPGHNAGAEWFAHMLALDWQRRGWPVRILGRDVAADYEFEGVCVQTARSPANLYGGYEWAELVVTHLDLTVPAMGRARRARLPIVHLVHNHRQLAANRVEPGPRTLAVFNSRWLVDASGWRGRKLIVNPPVPLDRYRPVDGPHDSLTLSNLTAAKGAALFYELAELLPSQRFLGVRGAYGHQLPPPILPNLELVEPTADVATILARTRVVVAPSSYESWGRFIHEAAAAAIPAVAASTPGIEEAAVAARVVPQGQSSAVWRDAVTELAASWQPVGRRMRRRAVELADRSRQQLGRLATELLELVG